MSDPTLLVVEGVVGVAAIAGVRRWVQSGDQSDPVPAVVQFPAELTATQVEALLGYVAGLGRRAVVCFTVDGSAEALRFGLAAPYGPFQSLTAALRGIAPELRVDESEPDQTVFGYGARLSWRGAWPLLRTDQPEHAAAGLLGSLTDLRADERVRLCLAVRPAGRVRRPQPQRSPKRDGLAGQLRVRSALAPEELQAVRTKLAAPLLRVSIVIAADARSRDRAEHLISRVTAALRSRQSGRTRLVVRRVRGQRLRDSFTGPRQLERLGRSGVLLNTSELVGVLGWPLEAPRLPGLAYGTAPRLLPSSRIPRRGSGRVFGLSDWPGMTGRELRQPAAGAVTHSLVLGPTGVGKSTLVTGLALQQAAANEGFIFLDLKGDAADELLAGLPARRHDDVVVLDPTSDLPVPGLRTFGRGDPELTADLLLGTFRGLFEGTFGVFSEHYLRLAFLTLAADPAATLADVEPLFGNPAFRRRVLASVADPRLLSSWAAFDDLSAAQQAEQLGSPLRKVGALIGRRTIRSVIAQAEPRFDLRTALSQRQIVVVSLSPGRLGSEAVRLLAALLLWELYSAVLARQAIPAAKRAAFGVYIDEPKLLASIPVPLDSMFELFRGMNVGITLTGQAITQLPPDVRAAALTNASTLVAFRQNARADAELLARQLPGVSAEQLQHVDKFSAVMRLGLGDGEVAPTVSGTTQPLPAPTTDPSVLRQQSAARFGRSPDEVDVALAARHGLTPLPGSAGDHEVAFGRRRAS
jgi:hypothetical protein